MSALMTLSVTAVGGEGKNYNMSLYKPQTTRGIFFCLFLDRFWVRFCLYWIVGSEKKQTGHKRRERV